MNEDKIKEFYVMAVDYCTIVRKTKITKSMVEDMIKRIMKLYLAALELPKIDGEEGLWKEEYENIRVEVDSEIDRYFETFDPYEADSFVGTTINDSLEGIYDDLSKGIVQYESGNIKNAVFEWRETHAWHWGNHAVSVLRALHQIRANNWYKE